MITTFSLAKCFSTADLLSIRSAIEHLLFISPKRKLLYVTDVTTAPLSAAANDRTKPSHKFEHLSCFLPGLLALGASTLTPADGLSDEERELHMWAARGLAYACWMTYQDFETGLGPDEVVMDHVQPSADNPFGMRWLPAVTEWRMQGRPGGTPPGLSEASPTRTKRDKDYLPRRSSYHLRPEVRRVLPLPSCSVCADLGMCVDCRELLLFVENDGR